MITTQQLEELARRIGEGFPARRVVLFGSHAAGAATSDSDVDLLVVAETRLPRRKRYGAVRRMLADFPAAFDIFVETPEEYDRSCSVVNTVAYLAAKNGRVLYEG